MTSLDEAKFILETLLTKEMPEAAKAWLVKRYCMLLLKDFGGRYS